MLALKKHRVAVWIILLVLVGLIAAIVVPKIKTHLQFLELEEKYNELVDVKNWPGAMVFKADGVELDPVSVQQVKDAVSQLKLEGQFETQDYYDRTFTGSGMLPCRSILIYDSKGTATWSLNVYENDSYCYESRTGLSLKNSAPLYKILEELSSSASMN